MATMEDLAAEALGEALPPPMTVSDLEVRVRHAVAASGRKVVALDDDPTGVQTVHDTTVLARWDAGTFSSELCRPESLFFVLTNSRSLPEEGAVALNHEIAENLQAASQQTGVRFVI